MGHLVIRRLGPKPIAVTFGLSGNTQVVAIEKPSVCHGSQLPVPVRLMSHYVFQVPEMDELTSISTYLTARPQI
jgi:hypothetical protein